MRINRTDLATAGAYLAAGAYLLAAMWLDPHGHVLRDNLQDQVQFEWQLTRADHLLTHGGDPFFTDLLNAPRGVNEMANTTMLGAALPLAPVTLAFGPTVSLLVLLTLGPAGTATAWYHVLSRHLTTTTGAAIAGGAFCGFAPAMVSHATGHPNICGQYLVPFLVLAVLRFKDPNNPVRKGVALAALVGYQAFLNEELLLLTALALGVFLLAHRGVEPAQIRAAAKGFATAAAIGGAVLAYPLAVQFFGPQAYHGLPSFIDGYGADLAAYPAFAQQSLAGSRAAAEPLSQGPTEQNAFFGWPLLVVSVALARWYRADRRIFALAVTGAVFAVLSLGRTLVVHEHSAGLPLPWLALGKLPLLDSVVPTRFTLVVTVVIGLLLASVLDLFARAEPAARRLGRVAIAAALVPLVPVPLRVDPAPPVPRFFTSGDWRSVIPAGGTAVIAPFNDMHTVLNMRWQTATGLGFRLVGGYFLGPRDGVTGRRAKLGAPPSLTSRAFTDPDAADEVADPAAIRDELARWHVDAVLVGDQGPRDDRVRAAVERVLGPGRKVDDVWVWQP